MRKSLRERLIIRFAEQMVLAKLQVMLKLFGIAAALALPTCAFAVGMGGINVVSALGQPLKANIDLVSVNKSEKSSLVARLAAPDVYKGAGLEYPSGNKFTFQVESRADGESYLKVSSAQPINDPFVSMLVELTWSSGKLLREYTFLLDPPGYSPEQPKPAEVQAVAPVVQPAEVAKPLERPVPSEPVLGTGKAIEQPARKPVLTAPDKQSSAGAAVMNVATGNVTVQRGDTLNKIAEQNKPPEVSLERMLVALYRANADQFDGGNMNRIRTGKILRLPDQNELMSVEQSDAVKEIRAQAADWNAYRQKLAGAAAASSQSQVDQQVATGKITSSVADKAPVAKESAREVLKLSKGEAPGDKAAAGAAGKSITAQDKKNAAQEEAIATAKAAKEAQGRAELLEKNLEDMQRLAKLKSEVAAQVPPAGAVAPEVPAASSAAAASDVAAAGTAKPVSKQATKPKPEVVEPEPSLMDQILGEPLYLAGGAAALLGLVGLGFMMTRRRKAASQDALVAMPILPVSDNVDFTTSTAAAGAVAAQLDDVDPISEAELFLNFGRDAQAEEILKEALQNTPNNHQIHLKLLGIYANRKDVSSFAGIARQLQDSGDEEAWQQAAAMGRKLEPDNPMYGRAEAIEDAVSGDVHEAAQHAMPDFILDDTAVAQEQPAPDVDFDLDALSDEAISDSDRLPEDVSQVADHAEVTPISGQDFIADAVTSRSVSPSGTDVTRASTDFDVTSTDHQLDIPDAMDFDITSADSSAQAESAHEEATLPNLDDLIFDVTAAPTTQKAAQPEGEKFSTVQADDGEMAFTLDFPIEEDVAKPASGTQPAEADFAGINLNFDEVAVPAEPTPEERSENWHEVATKLDLARAYQEMGDATGAREILEEVMREGDVEQREAAQSMLDELA